MAEVEVNPNKPPRMNVTVTVVPTRRFRFRIWTALKLIKMAAWLLNWRLDVHVDEETT